MKDSRPLRRDRVSEDRGATTKEGVGGGREDLKQARPSTSRTWEGRGQ